MSRAALQRPHLSLVSANTGIPRQRHTAGSLDNGSQPPHDGDMEQRVTRLEVIAEDLRNDVHDIRQDLRDMRQEFREEMRDMRQEFREDISNGFKSLRVNMWLATLSAIGISLAAMYGIVQTTIAAIDTGRASVSVQQPAQPPIIINVPPSAAPSEPPAKP